MVKKIESIKDEKFVKICPRCKSTNISIDPTNPLFGSEGLPPTYICNKCNYTNKIFPEIAVSEIKSFKKSKIKVNKEALRSDIIDKSYGKFMVRGIWKISGPLLIILSLIFFYAALNPVKCYTKPSDSFIDSPNEFNQDVQTCEKDFSKTINPDPLIYGLSLFFSGLVAIYFSYVRKYKD
jgi:hypothetical protein